MMNQEHDLEIEEEIKKLSLNTSSDDMGKLSSLSSVSSSAAVEDEGLVTPIEDNQMKEMNDTDLQENNEDTVLQETDKVQLKSNENTAAATKDSKILKNASSLFQGDGDDLFTTSLTDHSNNHVPNFIPSQQQTVAASDNTSISNISNAEATTSSFTNRFSQPAYSTPAVNNHVSNFQHENANISSNHTGTPNNGYPSFSPYSTSNIGLTMKPIPPFDPSQQTDITGSLQNTSMPNNGFPTFSPYKKQPGSELVTRPVPQFNPNQISNNSIPVLDTSSMFSFNQNGQKSAPEPPNMLPTPNSKAQPTIFPFNNNNANLVNSTNPSYQKQPAASPPGLFIPSMYSPSQPAVTPSSTPQSQFFVPSQATNGASQTLSPPETSSYPANEYGQSTYSNIALDQNSSYSNTNDQGLWHWIKKAVNGNFKQQLKHATDSVLTTLDPGMEDYLNSSNLSVCIASQDISILHGVKQAFNEVFGNIDIQNHSYPVSPNVPHGFDAAVASVDQHLGSNGQMNYGSSSSSNAVISCIPFVMEINAGRFAVSMCLGLKERRNQTPFYSFSQPISVPQNKQAMFQDGANVMHLLESQDDWCLNFTGGLRKFQLVYNTALCVAYQYQAFLKEQKSAESQQQHNRNQHQTLSYQQQQQNYQQNYQQQQQQQQQQQHQSQQQPQCYGQQAYQPDTYQSNAYQPEAYNPSFSNSHQQQQQSYEQQLPLSQF